MVARTGAIKSMNRNIAKTGTGTVKRKKLEQELEKENDL